MNKLSIITNWLDQTASDILAAAQDREFTDEERDFLHALRTIAMREYAESYMRNHA